MYQGDESPPQIKGGFNMKHEIITGKILFMLSHGFKKVIQPPNVEYIIADNKYYPISWLLNDYIFYNKICRIK